MDEKSKKRLIETAIAARGEAYAPYSGFKVGAAVLCSDGTLYSGCNIENASYPCGICAERTAVAKAVSEGKREFAAVAIVGSSSEKCSPCGVCRQFLYEFSPGMLVISCDKNGNNMEHILSGMLPEGFGSASL